jgi:hypothetical protein
MKKYLSVLVVLFLISFINAQEVRFEYNDNLFATTTFNAGLEATGQPFSIGINGGLTNDHIVQKVSFHSDTPSIEGTFEVIITEYNATDGKPIIDQVVAYGNITNASYDGPGRWNNVTVSNGLIEYGKNYSIVYRRFDTGTSMTVNHGTSGAYLQPRHLSPDGFVFTSTQARTTSFMLWGSNDTFAPYFTVIPTEPTILEGDSVSAQFNATDDQSLPISWSIDDTSQFSITSSGLLSSIVTLPVGTHPVNVIIQDNLGNTNSTLWTVTVTPSGGEGVIAVCQDSDVSWTDAAALTGLIFTIILVALVLGTLVLAVTGIINLGIIIESINLENVPQVIVLIGVTFLVIATMSFLIASNICVVFGGV